MVIRITTQLTKGRLFFNVCILFFFACYFAACSGGVKDSKEKADSVNKFYDSLNNKKGNRGDREVSAPDAKFAADAADGGIAEVELAQLALQRSTDPDVKAFAAMMIKDHSKANEELKEIAKNKRVALPVALGKDEQDIKAKLGSTNVSGFDSAYIDAMIKDHQKDIAAFKDAKKLVHYPEMTAFIDSTLPVLKMHYDAVLKLKAKINK